MKSNEVKTKFAALLGVKPSALRCSTIPSTGNPWVDLSVKPDADSIRRGNLSYSVEIPELARRVALMVVYGPVFGQGQSIGGNIRHHSISLHENEWDRFFGALAAITPGGEQPLESAAAYLSHRA